MNSKKIYSFLLLFAISFSVMHDYTFAVLDNHGSSVKEYVSEMSPSMDKKNDNLCDIHFEYHTTYTFPAISITLTSIGKIESFFTYNEIFLSQKQFDFLKPPIA